MKPVRAFLFLFVLVLLCIGCNMAGTLIDTPKMRESVRQGTAMLCEQGATPELTGGFKTSQMDNFTSVLILKTAGYTGPETFWQKVFGGFRTDLPKAEGQNAWEAFCTYADGSESPTGGLSYSRYWHGYTLPLRILLCFFNVSNLQMLFFGLELLLTVLLFILLDRKKMLFLLPGLFCSLFFLMPAATGLCIQYVPVTLVTFVSCILLLLYRDEMDTGIGLPAVFAGIGIMTNYLDLLTFPLISLGYPIVLLLAMRIREGADARKTAWEFLLCCGAWGIAFAGFWLLKWLLTSLVFRFNILGGILSQVFLRTSSASNGHTFSRISAFATNLQLLLAKPAYLLLLGLALPASLIFSLRGPRKFRPVSLLFLVAAVIPVAYMFLTANHIHDHYYYTYRNLTGSVFAISAFLATLRA